jgi:hypothetical protein
MGPVAPREAGTRICAPRVPPQLDLDHAVAPVSGPTIVRRASAADIHSLIEAAKALIPGKLADEGVVRRVWAHHPDSLWGFFQNGELVGGLAMLMLNEAGVKALMTGRLDGANPRDEHLASPAEAPEGIYIWAVAHSGASDGIAKLFARLQAPEYRLSPVYGAAVTPSGEAFFRKWGFSPVPGGPPNLFRYIRGASLPPQRGD